jgi:alpha-galactosidase/6-phospho-beta-glucosidase family protein
MKGANGAETYAKRLQIAPENLKAATAGLPGFAFMTELRDGKADLLPKLKKAAEKEFRKLSKKEQRRINRLKRIPVPAPGAIWRFCSLGG